MVPNAQAKYLIMQFLKYTLAILFCGFSLMAFSQKGESDSKVQPATTDEKPAYMKMDLLKASKEYARTQALPEGEIYIVVEEMPLYPGCEAAESGSERRCTNESIIAYIVKHVKYPAALKEKNVHGSVVAQFVISNKGSIHGVSILRTPAHEFAEEVKRVFELMKNETDMKWTPGRQRGMPVNVKMTIPIKFKPNK